MGFDRSFFTSLAAFACVMCAGACATGVGIDGPESPGEAGGPGGEGGAVDSGKEASAGAGGGAGSSGSSGSAGQGGGAAGSSGSAGAGGGAGSGGAGGSGGIAGAAGSSGAGGSAGAGGAPCNAPMHTCSGVCVAPSPSNGCTTSTTCTPCATPANGAALCSAGGTCDFTCASGFQKSGSQCVSSNPAGCPPSQPSSGDACNPFALPAGACGYGSKVCSCQGVFPVLLWLCL